jgi:uncharacterized protein YlxW (UPF0749 family)
MFRRPSVRGMTAFVVFAAAGFLFATSALSSHGVDLRASSVTDLDTLLRHDRARVDAMQATVADLNAQVSRLGRQVDDREVRRLQKRVAALKAPAGFTAVTGPGVRVTLDDAPKSEINQAVESGTVTVDTLVVHQQDIQAVVNALWAGGAEAVMIQGQRVISTTGIKCVGNTVVLHGVPYSPPYRIAAVGDPVALVQALDDSEYIAAYRTIADRYHLGWDLRTLISLTAPAYEGTPDLRYARLGDTGS